MNLSSGRLTKLIPSLPAIRALIIANSFFIAFFSTPQFNDAPACAACGIELTTAIPNPPAIIADMIAIILRISVIVPKLWPLSLMAIGDKVPLCAIMCYLLAHLWIIGR